MIFQTDDGRVVEDEGLSNLTEVLAAISSSHGTFHLHLHGGLIDDERGVEIAHRLLSRSPDDDPAGFGPLGDTRSLYWVWQTGALEVLIDKIERNKFIRIARSIATRLTANQVLEGDEGARSGAYGQTGIIDKQDVARSQAEIRNDNPDPLEARKLRSDAQTELGENAYKALLEDDPEVKELALALTQEMHGGEATGVAVIDGNEWDQLKAKDEAISNDDDQERSLALGLAGGWVATKVARIVYASVKRFTSGRHHGLTCTVAEETIREFFVVRTIWDEIKRRSAAQFLTDDVAGKQVAAALADKASSDPDWTFVITAHSAGSILAFDLLDHVSNFSPSHPFTKLFLIAPAATAERAKSSGEALAKVVKGWEVVNLNDEAEKTDRVKRLLYPRSILYLVSGALEVLADMPLIGMERFYEDKLIALNKLQAGEQAPTQWMRQRFADDMIVTGEAFPQGHQHTGITHGIDSDPSVLRALSAWIRGVSE